VLRIHARSVRMIVCSVSWQCPPIRRGGVLRRGEDLNPLGREDRQLKLERCPVSRDAPGDARTGLDGSDFLHVLKAQRGAGLVRFFFLSIVSDHGADYRPAISNPTYTGTWSDGFSQPRTWRSTPASMSRSAACGDSSRWSMRMPLFFWNAPA
jgi:hypothetical protein